MLSRFAGIVFEEIFGISLPHCRQSPHEQEDLRLFQKVGDMKPNSVVLHHQHRDNHHQYRDNHHQHGACGDQHYTDGHQGYACGHVIGCERFGNYRKTL